MDPTCGQGLAQHSELHMRLATLIGAMADNLEAHLSAIGHDARSRPERDAYESLVVTHRRTAAELASLSEEMASYRDIPMANHDMEKMSGPAAVGAFQAFIEAEESVAELLAGWVERDRQMLAGRPG